MKYKITDLMDLYEDPKCPFDPSVDQGQKIETQKETIEVKQTKHRFGWKEGLSLAAALGIVVLGGFGVKRLLDRGPAPGSPGESSSAPPVVTEVYEPLADGEHEALNRFLTAFAQQGVENLDADLDEDAELIRFAFIYRRIYDPESIPVQPDDDGELWDTLSPEQVNETLTRLLGRTVTPDETADYNLLRSDPVGGHCSFHDGYFWQEPSGGDHLLRFVLTDRPLRMEDAAGPCVITDFTVYAVNLTLWPLVELDALPALSQEEAAALVQAEKLKPILNGRAQARITEDGYRLWSLASQPYELDDEEDPHTEPTGFDPVLETDWAEMGRLANALAQQGITDLEADLSDEYALVSFAHIYTKIYDRSAITYQNAAGEGYETLSLEQVNSTLNSLFGKSVSPAEGTDYTLQRGDNYAVHEQYHDGTFWFPAADGEIRTRFAVPAYVRDAGEWGWEIGFEVFEADLDRWPEYPDWDQSDYEAIRGFHEEGKLHASGTGTARFLKTEDGLQISAYHVELADQPETPQAETQPDEALTEEIKNLFREETGWYCRALTSQFHDPANVDLYQLFYIGIPGVDDSLTEEEAASLSAQGAVLNLTSCNRLPKGVMNEVLLQLFGISLEDCSGRGLEEFFVFPDSECYYHFHGDTNVFPITIKEIRQREDGKILFTYLQGGNANLSDSSAQLWTAALWHYGDGGWHILSNLPGEWVTAEDAGALAQLYWGTGELQLETKAADGTRVVRELSLGADGSVNYRWGDPDSEFSVWEHGSWRIENDHTLVVEHWVTDEIGNRLEESHISYYACEIRDGSLILTQRSTVGFYGDPSGTELRFPFNAD